MKNNIIILFLLLSINTFSQNLPSEFEDGFTFPIGTKFTIKLDATNPKKIKYSIIKFEPFQETIDSWETDKLFEENGEENTIDFVFCLGTSGETEKEKQKNMKVHLLFKNRSKLTLTYDSEIQTKEDGEFKQTSNMGSYPGALGNEMWPYMIFAIELRNFKIRDK